MVGEESRVTGFEVVHDGGEKVPRSHRDVGDAEVEEYLGGVGLPAPVEQCLYPLQVLFEGGIDGVGDQVIHRERLGEVRTRGLPHAGLVVEVDLPLLHDNVILGSGGQIHAFAVDRQRPVRDG